MQSKVWFMFCAAVQTCQAIFTCSVNGCNNISLKLLVTDGRVLFIHAEKLLKWNREWCRGLFHFGIFSVQLSYFSCVSLRHCSSVCLLSSFQFQKIRMAVFDFKVYLCFGTLIGTMICVAWIGIFCTLCWYLGVLVRRSRAELRAYTSG